MLGQVRLFKTKLFLDRPRREFPVAQQLEDGNAGGMRKSLKDACLESTQRVLHIITIFDSSNICNNADKLVEILMKATLASSQAAPGFGAHTDHYQQPLPVDRKSLAATPDDAGADLCAYGGGSRDDKFHARCRIDDPTWLYNRLLGQMT